jgi:hypothetical protein
LIVFEHPLARLGGNAKRLKYLACGRKRQAKRTILPLPGFCGIQMGSQQVVERIWMGDRIKYDLKLLEVE